jgi:predicted transcriptional regulator
MRVKDVGLRIRIDRDLRDRFLEVCRIEDRPAAQVLREFMREYVARRQPRVDAQGSLFPLEHDETEGRGM